MTEPSYTARIDAIHVPFAVTLDQPSFRSPHMMRVTWKPSDAQARALCPEWIDGQPAMHLRNYDSANTSRWFIRAKTYGFRDVELETVKEGDRLVMFPIPPPKTRTRGRWFTWECGQWVDKPNHDYHQACYCRARALGWSLDPAGRASLCPDCVRKRQAKLDAERDQTPDWRDEQKAEEAERRRKIVEAMPTEDADGLRGG